MDYRHYRRRPSFPFGPTALGWIIWILWVLLGAFLFFGEGCTSEDVVPDSMTLSLYKERGEVYGEPSRNQGASIDFTWELK